MSIIAPDLAALKAADVSNISLIYDRAIFTWMTGDFTEHADDLNIVNSDNEPLTTGAWVRQTADKMVFQHDSADSTVQTVADAVRRERLNLYDKIPKALWPAIEAGTNTEDLTAYVVSALGSGRGINVCAGTFRMALNVAWESIGQSLRGEGRHLTYFENVDDRPVIKLDSSSAHIFGFELEDMWLRNRAPGTFTNCDLLTITGAADGETYQNDKHHFRRLWLYQGRDNIACYKRCIWPIFDDIQSTGAFRDALHIETAANVNQWTLRDIVLKGAGRNGIFFKHDFSSLATGWTLQNISTEDCQFEGWRFTGTFGVQGFGVSQSTFENNALAIATGASHLVDGIRRRKANVFLDMPYVAGFDFNTTTFYNGNSVAANNPDWHIYNEAGGAVVHLGSMANSRFMATQAGGGDISWPIGLTYHANNLAAGEVLIDRSAGGLDFRDMVSWTEFVPNLQFNGSVAGVAFTNRRGLYQIVGRDVQFKMYVSISSKGSATGPATISLPHAAISYATLPMTVVVSADGIAAPGQIVGRIDPGSSVVALYRYHEGSLVPLSAADCGNFSAFSVSGSYAM